jgi:succinyl-diaminopimelate desuccinylase
MSGIKKQIQDIIVDLIEIENSVDIANANKEEYRKKKYTEMVDYVKGYLDDIGMEVETITSESSPILVAKYGEPGSVVFSGHLDSLSPSADWTYTQGQISNGKIYGSGTVDMKGSVVSMIKAAEKLVERKVPFAIALTTDEEEAMTGANYLSKHEYLRKAQVIVMGEPTNMKIGVVEKGLLDLVLTIHGKSAHGSIPSMGDNAIIRALKFLKMFNNIKGTKLKNESLKGKLSINVATINGGVKHNLVPDRCDIGIEIRFPPPYSPDDIYRMVSDNLSQHKKKFSVVKKFELPSIVMDRNSPIISTMQKISNTEISEVEYTSEAVLYQKINKNILFYGCGDNEILYQPDEFIKLDDIMKTAEIYRKYAIEVYENKTKKASR